MAIFFRDPSSMPQPELLFKFTGDNLKPVLLFHSMQHECVPSAKDRVRH